jgi:hypothetical protein
LFVRDWFSLTLDNLESLSPSDSSGVYDNDMTFHQKIEKLPQPGKVIFLFL